MKSTAAAATALVNVAAIATATRALGPGLRGVAWVQGCPFRCRGCVSEDWIPQRPAMPMSPSGLADRLLTDPEVTGLTFSGGEPMVQAAGLAETFRIARAQRPLTLVCYTGYRLERLRRQPPHPGVADLLDVADVLIDGLYVAGADDGLGLRGSSNQRIHHLTGRLADGAARFDSEPRRAEITIWDDRVRLVGLPPPGLLTATARLWADRETDNEGDKP